MHIFTACILCMWIGACRSSIRHIQSGGAGEGSVRLSYMYILWYVYDRRICIYCDTYTTVVYVYTVNETSPRLGIKPSCLIPNLLLLLISFPILGCLVRADSRIAAARKMNFFSDNNSYSVNLSHCGQTAMETSRDCGREGLMETVDDRGVGWVQRTVLDERGDG